LLALVALTGVSICAVQSLKQRAQMLSHGFASKEQSCVSARKRERSPGEGGQQAIRRARTSSKDLAPWLAILPLAWLLWQCLAATQTADLELTKITLKHFAANVVCFYLGYFCLSQCPRSTGFWVALMAAFALVLVAGWDQHFGGIEATRRYFY